MTEHEKHAMHDSSLEQFKELKDEGEYILEQAKILQIIEDNPDQTKNQILKIAIDEGKHVNVDSNWVAPKITDMVKKGLIVRPKKIMCPITNSINFIHRAAPKSWHEQRELLVSSGILKKNIVKKWQETQSKSKPGTIHTTILWHDGTVSCTCTELHNRDPTVLCHHAKGLIQAETGENIDLEKLQEKYKQLQDDNKTIEIALDLMQRGYNEAVEAYNLIVNKYNKLQKDIEEYKVMFG